MLELLSRYCPHPNNTSDVAGKRVASKHACLHCAWEAESAATFIVMTSTSQSSVLSGPWFAHLLLGPALLKAVSCQYHDCCKCDSALQVDTLQHQQKCFQVAGWQTSKMLLVSLHDSSEGTGRADCPLATFPARL